MNDNSKPSQDLVQASGFLHNLINQGRLVWRLFNDRRVPGWAKLIPVAGALYLLSPIDLMPDMLLPGLGELDDMGAILLSLKMFVELSPPEIVREHLQNLVGRARGQQEPSDAVIDAPYRVVDQHDHTQEP